MQRFEWTLQADDPLITDLLNKMQAKIAAKRSMALVVLPSTPAAVGPASAASSSSTLVVAPIAMAPKTCPGRKRKEAATPAQKNAKTKKMSPEVAALF